ncbi:hypothetical protein 5 [Bracoviriform demolitoris]|uniref:Uncharacterized protein M5 n=1 Tax=Microplitis demolitor bracovirus (isolate Webb) TaxID=654919 RepID=YM5_MDBVW|nr:hypothetical protein 5 [Bracoviriform demolitoris]Q5I131.1 RecName: Full=Uncharacterized protein M5 [Microplitis demolitor bracovirus (isolate Webb)]AAW51801.1 hypothetical protein 5 [Bracoviriform demolitoris]KAG6558509.1 orph-M5 [Microplitis demolitor]
MVSWTITSGLLRQVKRYCVEYFSCFSSKYIIYLCFSFFQTETMQTYQYHVAKFAETHYDNLDKYVCVPDSWIRRRRKTKQKVSVVYFEGNRSRTKKRIKSNDN